MWNIEEVKMCHSVPASSLPKATSVERRVSYLAAPTADYPTIRSVIPIKPIRGLVQVFKE